VVSQLELRRVSSGLAEALKTIKLLEGLAPICSYCKGIRNDQGCWLSLENFIQQRSDLKFTHGVCNACMRKHFPDVAKILLDDTEH
jgi:hypothetical protein